MWRTLDNLDVSGKRVLWRVDFNVPVGADGRVDETEDWRIRRALPTLAALRQRGARVIIASHRGEPAGREFALSMKPIATHLRELVGFPVPFVSAVVGEGVHAAVEALEAGEALMIENLRFEAGEVANDPALVQALAAFTDMYVSDAFGAIHRAHASLVGLPKLKPAAAGLLLQSEVAALQAFLENPRRPAVAILGGAKAHPKLKVLRRLLELADTVLLGGVLANTMLAATGISVGVSPIDRESIPEMRSLADSPKLQVPRDVVVAAQPEASARSTVLAEIQPGDIIYDVGTQTIAAYTAAIRGAGSLIWNGPVGLVELDQFASGTAALAAAVGQSSAEAILGGGDTVAFMMRRGLARHFTHISTGGGAMFEFLVGGRLPGLEALGYYG